MTAGRPPAFKAPDEMQKAVDAYFAEREADGKPPTIAGISYYLGFEDRDSFTRYGDRPEFSRTIKTARLRIEQDRSERLLSKDGFTPGVIFDLKNNHGWKDRTETEHSGRIEYANMTEEEIDARLAKLTSGQADEG